MLGWKSTQLAGTASLASCVVNLCHVRNTCDKVWDTAKEQEQTGSVYLAISCPRALHAIMPATFRDHLGAQEEICSAYAPDGGKVLYIVPIG